MTSPDTTDTAAAPAPAADPDSVARALYGFTNDPTTWDRADETTKDRYRHEARGFGTTHEDDDA